MFTRTVFQYYIIRHREIKNLYAGFSCFSPRWERRDQAMKCPTKDIARSLRQRLANPKDGIIILVEEEIVE